MTANLELEFEKYAEKVFPTMKKGGHQYESLKITWFAAQLVLFIEILRVSALPCDLGMKGMDRLHEQIKRNTTPR